MRASASDWQRWMSNMDIEHFMQYIDYIDIEELLPACAGRHFVAYQKRFSKPACRYIECNPIAWTGALEVGMAIRLASQPSLGTLILNSIRFSWKRSALRCLMEIYIQRQHPLAIYNITCNGHLCMPRARHDENLVFIGLLFPMSRASAPRVFVRGVPSEVPFMLLCMLCCIQLIHACCIASTGLRCVMKLTCADGPPSDYGCFLSLPRAKCAALQDPRLLRHFAVGLT